MTNFLQVTSFDPLVIDAPAGPAGPQGPPGSAIISDNGDGTVTVNGAQAVDNGDGTYTFNSGSVRAYTKAGADAAFAAGAGGGGAVSSVNSRTGAVVLTADDTPDGTTNKAYTAAEKTKLAGIATGATAVTVGAAGSGAGSALSANDPTTTNGRTPLAHASTHASGGSDPVTIAESQVTNLVTDLASKSTKMVPTASKTSAYTAVDGDLVLCDATGGAFTVTLPTPTAGRRIGIKKTDSSANAVTVATTSGLIDGLSTRPLSVQYQAQIFVADGTNWQRDVVPGVAAIAATGTPSSSTYLRGDGSWSTPAGGGAATPGLLIGSQFPLVDAVNALQGFTLNTEYCFGFVLPGSGTLDSITLDVVGAGDTGSVLRFGVRANDAGKPSATVTYENTVTATTGGWKQTTGLSIPYGASGSEILWLSLVWQGGTTTSPTHQRGAVSPWFFQAAPAAGYGAAGTGNAGWTQNTLTQTGVTGTLTAKATAPLTLGNWAGSGGGLPHVYVRRGT